MKRAVILVIDSMGIGAMPDAPNYNDTLECNTLGNVIKHNNGLNIPNLKKLGLANILPLHNIRIEDNPIGRYGLMAEVSEGKDTTTGHWELAGLILDEPFKVYPEGFPSEVIQEFIKRTNCGGVIANYPSSGTEIIEKMGDEHVNTKFPIVYTSADSVFQIAAHIDVIPLETQYKWCEAAREILTGEYNVSRVIARPFEGKSGEYKRVSKDRRDYSVAPHKKTVLNDIVENGGRVVGIGKIEDIFVKSGVTHAVHTGSNDEGLKLTVKALKNELNLDEIAYDEARGVDFDKELIFTNLVDTDMLFGHRNDANGYAKAIEAIDESLSQVLDCLTEDDLLIITADHGCDPTVDGTDHTREYVPVLAYSKTLESKNLGLRESFSDVAKTVAQWLEVDYSGPGLSLIN